MYKDQNLSALFNWVSQELEALILESELTVHNRQAEIEQDLANAPTAEELLKGALTEDQATIVNKMVDMQLRKKDNEHDTAIRKTKMSLLQQVRDAIDAVANGQEPDGLSMGEG